MKNVIVMDIKTLVVIVYGENVDILPRFSVNVNIFSKNISISPSKCPHFWKMMLVVVKF